MGSWASTTIWAAGSCRSSCARQSRWRCAAKGWIRRGCASEGLAMPASQRDPVTVAGAFRFACPNCRAGLDMVGPDVLRCPVDRAAFHCADGIWHCLPPDRAAVFAPFLRDYTSIRDAEGYGYDDLARLRRLPEVDSTEPLAWQWRMRA